MKNAIVCQNCNSENPNYIAICKTCKSYLRERVVNIDLWNIIWKIIETPRQAFTKIIYAEHKNFIIFLALVISIKYFIYSLMLAVPVFSKNDALNNIIPNYIGFTGLFILLILLISVVIILLLRTSSISVRFKDIVSLLIYSQIPNSVLVIIFFPVEMVLFGNYLFTFNPSPFTLKSNAAYTLLFIEILMNVWSAVLSIMALYAASQSKLWSAVLGIIYVSCIAGLIVVFARYII